MVPVKAVRIHPEFLGNGRKQGSYDAALVLLEKSVSVKSPVIANKGHPLNLGSKVSLFQMGDQLEMGEFEVVSPSSCDGVGSMENKTFCAFSTSSRLHQGESMIRYREQIRNARMKQRFL